MSILNYGSLNIDHVYGVPHFVRPGETLASDSYTMEPGGKGANQSAAIARAGGSVMHAGKIGADGFWLVDQLRECGVDTSGIRTYDGVSGHTIIQIDAAAENAIILHGGGNQEISTSEIDETLAAASPGTVVLLQNEISNTGYIIRKAAEIGLPICINPAPMDPDVLTYPLELVHTLVVNETEGAAITGPLATSHEVLDALVARFPKPDVILTLGAQGVLCRSGDERYEIPAAPAHAVDTTAAGDTFIGYYLARRQAGDSVEVSLVIAGKASAIAVSRPGAMRSIPLASEVL